MKRIVHVQLGRNGDLLMLLPCWRRLYLERGEKPVVVVAREFADLLRGASYVEPDVINGHWYGAVVRAAQMARLKYGDCVITQCGGVGHDTDESAYANFGEAMRTKAGFPGPYDAGMPLVFDRRNPDREIQLVARLGWLGWDRGKPLVLYNFAGLSSPLPAAQAIRNRLRRYARDFELCNLGLVRAERLYDLLGLYDVAAGLITIDTATLHLAAGSGIRMLAYVRGGWSSAVAKPGAISVPYAEAEEQLEAVDVFMQSLQPVASETLC